jgi:hypothetical protein
MKIDSAAAFVADVTPIGLSEAIGERRPKHVANPNVLIELGYAKKSLTVDRVVQVWNTAFTNCSVEDLPFDMRGRRGPISFHLAQGASKEDLRSARVYLTKELKVALKAIVTQLPREPAQPLAWKPSRLEDPSVWFAPNEDILVNEDWYSGRISFEEAPARYVRLLPSSWAEGSFEVSYAMLLGHTMGYSAGQARGGLLTYTGSLRVPQERGHTQATMWFRDTGEVWAFDRLIVAEYRGQPMVYGDDLVKGWVSFVVAQLKLLRQNGGTLPIHVKLGVTGLLGTFWPVNNPAFSSPEALEDRMEHEFMIGSDRPEEWLHHVVKAWGRYRMMYSVSPPREDEVQTMIRSIHVLRGSSDDA